MTIYPTIKTGGGNIEMARESALGTAGSYYDLRVCEDTDPTFPTDTREVKPVSSKGYRSPGKREAQISFEKATESAIKISNYVSGCATTTGGGHDLDIPQAAHLFRAAGCTHIYPDANAGAVVVNVVDGTPSTTSVSLAADGSAIGYAGQVELPTSAGTNFLRFPMLTAAYSGAYTITPSMALPAIPDVGADHITMHTLTPPTGNQVTSSRTLAFRVSAHYPTSTETGTAWYYTGCAVAEIGDVTIESGTPLKIDYTLHCADRAWDRDGIDLSIESYNDSVSIPITDGAGNFRFGFADFSSYPVAATRTTGFRKAVWKPGIKTIPVMESGTTTSVNGWGGYLAYYTGSTIELTMDVNKDWWTTLESSGSQTAKYVEMVQPSAAVASTTWGLWMPKCYLTGKPAVDLWGEKEMTVTITLEPTTAGMATTSKTDQGDQPWYFAISATA